MNTAPNNPINTREDLQGYLQIAIQVEHATVPPYLTALYSIKADPKQSNLASSNIIRSVVVEEMLHLTLAANLLNAVGGAPDLIRRDFVPNYPAYLPAGETDFQVNLEKFSCGAIETFLKIERPTPPVQDCVVRIDDVAYVKHELLAEGRKSGRGLLPHFRAHTDKGDAIYLHYWSIGEFYKAIANGFKYLAEQMGEQQLFKGEAVRQVGPEYYHSAGGELHKVTNLETALQAIDLVADQGEGSFGRIYDSEGELAHYYRFDQIRRERYYRVETDKPDEPTGHPFKVYWDQVYPVRPNLKVANLPPNSEVRDAAVKFNEQYKRFLHLIHRALNGDPAALMPSFANMFEIKEAALRLIHNPLPSGDGHAAPTFEMS